jgi:hypothetical protein
MAWRAGCLPLAMEAPSPDKDDRPGFEEAGISSSSTHAHLVRSGHRGNRRRTCEKRPRGVSTSRGRPQRRWKPRSLAWRYGTTAFLLVTSVGTDRASGRLQGGEVMPWSNLGWWGRSLRWLERGDAHPLGRAYLRLICPVPPPHGGTPWAEWSLAGMQVSTGTSPCQPATECVSFCFASAERLDGGLRGRRLGEVSLV